MTNKKPQPLIERRLRSRCPVCGEISYSSGGIHPQCAVRQADSERMDHLKQMRREGQPDGARSLTTDVKPWHRMCPSCRTVLHFRSRTCDCGYAFANHAPPAGSEAAGSKAAASGGE